MGVNHVMGTVPAGKRWIVRDMTAAGMQSGTGGIRVAIVPGSGPALPIWQSGDLTLNQLAAATLRHDVLNAGEQLVAVGRTVSGSVRTICTASGYELTV